MRTLVAAWSIALAGCGGGSSEAEQPMDEPLIDGVAQTPIAPDACANESADAAEVRMAIARVRALAGLPSLHCDVRASAAARGHCDYVLANGEMTHVQQKGHRKFTGELAADRLRAASFEDDLAGEVLANTAGAGVILAPYGFMNSVYHRALFLRTETVSYGYAGGEGCATIDFGRRARVRDDVTVVWPPPGSFNVPLAFYASRETPNPTPGRDVVGSPISLVRVRALPSVEATLVGPEGALPATLLTHTNDPNRFVRVGEAHLIPLRALAPSTRYRAEFIVAGERIETSFTTAAR